MQEETLTIAWVIVARSASLITIAGAPLTIGTLFQAIKDRQILRAAGRWDTRHRYMVTQDIIGESLRLTKHFLLITAMLLVWNAPEPHAELAVLMIKRNVLIAAVSLLLVLTSGIKLFSRHRAINAEIWS